MFNVLKVSWSTVTILDNRVVGKERRKGGREEREERERGRKGRKEGKKIEEGGREGKGGREKEGREWHLAVLAVRGILIACSIVVGRVPCVPGRTNPERGRPAWEIGL